MFAGILTQAKGIIGISGTLSKTAAPSGGIVTSDAATLGVPGGSDGKMLVANRSDTGTVTLEFEKSASGSWVDETSLSTITFAGSDTVKARIRNATSGEASTFSLTESATGRAIGGPYTITAS